MAIDGHSLEGQLEYQKRLNSITNRIHAARDTNAILLELHSDLLGFFSAERLTIYVVDRVKKEIYSKVMTGQEVAEIRVGINSNSLAGFCAVSGRLFNMHDVYNEEELKRIDPRLTFDRSWDQKTGYRTKQVLVAPVTYDNRFLLGVIQLINKKDGSPFSPSDESSVLDIAKVLGIAFYKNQKTVQKARFTKFDHLISNNILTEKDLNKAFSRARTSKNSIEAVLMSEFGVSKDDIGRSLAKYFQTRFIPFQENLTVPGELLKNFKASFLKSNVFVPFSESDGKVTVVMESPNYLPARDIIKRIIKAREIEYCVSTREDILQMIGLFFGVDQKNLPAGSGSIDDILGQLESLEEDEEEEGGGVADHDSAIVQLVNKMIIDAYKRKASDIHIEPRQGKKNAVIRYRIDGACQVYQTIPHTYKKAIVSRVKIMSDLDISERRKPQDGKIKFSKFAPLDIELRVATIPTTGQNEDVVMRILTAGEPIPLTAMGMSERTYNTLLSMIAKPYGIVLVVGPTGSGKTTTLHAALAYINKPETKIWTAEDPVEITQEGLRQVQVAPKIGFNFATAMRAFLRADPDVIMVGEMRDKETVSTGIEASLTGHLVFSTLHTNSAPETITRLLDMGMDPFNFADALIGVLAQRLVRTLCQDCKEKYHPTREEYDGLVRAYDGDFEAIGFPYDDEFALYRAVGCARCNNTGYRGRTGIHELLEGTDTMKSLIQGKARMEDLRGQAIRDGMATLMQDGIRKVCLGITDLAQVRRVCIK